MTLLISVITNPNHPNKTHKINQILIQIFRISKPNLNQKTAEQNHHNHSRQLTTVRLVGRKKIQPGEFGFGLEKGPPWKPLSPSKCRSPRIHGVRGSDVVGMETWYQSEGRSGTRRVWIRKDYSTGEINGRAISKWVMMTQDTGQLQKVSDGIREEHLVFCSREPRLVCQEKDNRNLKEITKLGDPTTRHEFAPRRADRGANQHVNKATYIGGCMESTLQEIIDTHELRSITLDHGKTHQPNDAVDFLTSLEPTEEVEKLNGINGSVICITEKMVLIQVDVSMSRGSKKMQRTFKKGTEFGEAFFRTNADYLQRGESGIGSISFINEQITIGREVVISVRPRPPILSTEMNRQMGKEAIPITRKLLELYVSNSNSGKKLQLNVMVNFTDKTPAKIIKIAEDFLPSISCDSLSAAFKQKDVDLQVQRSNEVVDVPQLSGVTFDAPFAAFKEQQVVLQAAYKREVVGVPQVSSIITKSRSFIPQCIYSKRALMSNMAESEATWEPIDVMKEQFPKCHLEDKVNLEGEGIDRTLVKFGRPLIRLQYERRRKRGFTRAEMEIELLKE